MPNRAQEDAVINLKSVRELGKQLGFEWTMVAYELGLSRAEISQFCTATTEKKAQAQKMLEYWSEQLVEKNQLPMQVTESRLKRHSTPAQVSKRFPRRVPHRGRYHRSWDKPNKTKMLQDALERSGRKDLAEKLRCLHWGHQKLSNRVELPSAFPFLITVYKTINNKEGLKKINQLSHK